MSFPWDTSGAPDPVGALSAARERLGDTFVVDSGADRYFFVFSPEALRAFYAIPERVASKGLADYRMLLRKLPKELFATRRTFAHDLFGAQDVEGYLGHLDIAVARQIDELGAEGTFDVFALARRLGHRLALGCWMGDAAARPPLLDALITRFDRLDGADAFVHPERMTGRNEQHGADVAYERERAALLEVEGVVGELLGGPGDDGFLGEIARRWDDADADDAGRVRGVAGDVVVLHIATMTNLFAALGWTLAMLLLRPGARERVESGLAAGDTTFLERCEFEAIRIGQRSIMMRTVLEPCALYDGTRRYSLEPGVVLATMLPITNLTVAPGFDRFDPDRWGTRRLLDESPLGAREEVTTFGHGPHRCPAQRFSLSAIGRAVAALVTTYDLEAHFDAVRPLPSQIGGMARPADPCPVSYRVRSPRRHRVPL